MVHQDIKESLWLNSRQRDGLRVADICSKVVSKKICLLLLIVKKFLM